MLKLRHDIQGVTLLEVLLVLGIGSSIMLLAMRQYESMRRDADVEQVSFNVDQLFQAAADFYQANCRIQIDPVSGQVKETGKLDPRYLDADGISKPPGTPYPVTTSELKTYGFLTANLPMSPIINNAGTNNGYIVQYNRVTPTPDRTVETAFATTVKLGQIIMWRAQVSVELKNTTKATAYKNLLKADCLSTLDTSGLSVIPCSEVTAPPTAAPIYAVWERLPSFAVPASNSNMWTTNATIKQFTQLYETYSINYLGGVPASSYPQQYYLCGS